MTAGAPWAAASGGVETAAAIPAAVLFTNWRRFTRGDIEAPWVRADCNPEGRRGGEGPTRQWLKAEG